MEKNKQFSLKAVTLDGSLTLEKEVTFIKLKTDKGDMGILRGHANFVGMLGAGEMIVRCSEGEETYFVAGGFLEISNNRVTVLADDMVEADKLEAKRRAKEAAILLAKDHKMWEQHDIMSSKKKIKENMSLKKEKIY